MVCSTCGAPVPGGREACTTCGAPVRHLPAPVAPAGLRPAEGAGCPRCGFRGPGVGYFTKGSHLAILLALIVFALPVGLLYFAFRIGHQLCPRCGEDWGRNAARAGRLPRGEGEGTWKNGGAPVGAYLLAALAVILVAVGVGDGEVSALLVGLGAAGGSWLLFRNAAREREQRRAALLASLSQPVLRLAAVRQGRLTVTEVAAELGWSLKRAEKVLDSMDDGLRVRSEVTDEGVIVYDFPELAHAPRRVGRAGGT